VLIFLYLLLLIEMFIFAFHFWCFDTDKLTDTKQSSG
jgi:hypothetical protein